MANPTARDILNNALKRRDELRRESEALDTLIEAYYSILGIAPGDAETQEEQPDLYRGMSQRAIRTARINEMVDEARRIMVTERRPMKRGELVRRLEGRGFKILGTDKNKVFGTNLWRSGKFRMVEGKGYWPNDVALPGESLALDL